MYTSLKNYYIDEQCVWIGKKLREMLSGKKVKRSWNTFDCVLNDDGDIADDNDTANDTADDTTYTKADDNNSDVFFLSKIETKWNNFYISEISHTAYKICEMHLLLRRTKTAI